MSEIGGYRELETWRVAMELVLEGYAFSKAFPPQENYLLTSQLRKALVSIPSNIAEGHARRAAKGTLYHLAIALGSLAEADTQIELAIRLGYVSAGSAERLQRLIESTRRLLHGLRRAKRAKLALTVGGYAGALAVIAVLFR